MDDFVKAGTSQRGRPSSTGTAPVRLSFVTWPVVALLGASVATCLLRECAWGVATEARETLVGHAGTVRSIEFRPDGAMLSSVGFGDRIAIWDLTKRSETSFLRGVSDDVLCASFSPDNRLLAFSSRTEAVALHDLGTGKSQALDDRIAASAGASALVFAPDGATLAVGQRGGKISLWDTATARIRSTLDGHSEFVPSLAFSPDCATLASSGGDQLIRIWDVPTGRLRTVINSATNTLCFVIQFSPDGGLLLLRDVAGESVRLWDIATETDRAALINPSGAVVAAAFSPDGAVLAVGDLKGFVKFWDVATLKTRGKQLTHAGVCSLAFSPDGRVLATGGFDGAIHLWDVHSLIGD